MLEERPRRKAVIPNTKCCLPEVVHSRAAEEDPWKFAEQHHDAALGIAGWNEEELKHFRPKYKVLTHCIR